MVTRLASPLFKGWILALLLFPYEILANTDDMQIRTFAITYIDPQQLIPIIEPLLPAGSVVTASTNQLLVKSTNSGFSQIIPIIGELDHPPQTLLIRVRRVHDSTYDASVASGGANDVVGTQDGDRFDDEQSITLEDGGSGFVKTGESFPVRDWSLFFWGGAESTTYYKKITSGFYIKAKLRGDKVSLSVDWNHNVLQDQRTLPLRNQSAIDVEQTDSTVTIPIAKWVSLSNTSHQSLPQSDVDSYGTQDVGDPDKNVFIRVDVVSYSGAQSNQIH